jgi:hypothetical protein
MGVQDRSAAFNILTPQLITFLLSSDAIARGKTYIRFDVDRIYIAVDNDVNLFELPEDKYDLQTFTAQIETEVAYITSILDELLNNIYLFKKETKKC